MLRIRKCEVLDFEIEAQRRWQRDFRVAYFGSGIDNLEESTSRLDVLIEVLGRFWQWRNSFES